MSVAIGLAPGGFGFALSVGVSLAENDIANDVAAYIANAAANGQNVTTRGTGDITIHASEAAQIHALGIAASAALSGGVLAGISMSGAGADISNVILDKTNAYIDNSVIASGGKLELSATDTSLIDAKVGVLSGALGVGAVAGAIAVGVAKAENFIGWTAAGA